MDGGGMWVVYFGDFAFQIINPYPFMHSLCFSMNSWQFSSPYIMRHSSRAFFVSGHAQHGLIFFVSVLVAEVESTDVEVVRGHPKVVVDMLVI